VAAPGATSSPRSRFIPETQQRERHPLDQLSKVLPKEKFEPRAHDEQDERNLLDRVKNMFG
jgi:hypothetical protein